MKKIVIFIAVALAIIGGAYYLYVNDLACCTAETQINGELNSESAMGDEVGKAQPHPLSMEAFSQYEFNGQGLALGDRLAVTDDFIRYYITYQSDGLTISGIMNVPGGGGPFPVLILNHGYIDPAVYTNGRGLKREQDYLARQGYVVIHSDYRNHANSDKDPNVERGFRIAYAHDVGNLANAVRVSELPFLDKGNIGMLGHSMGGGIAQQLAVSRPGLVKAYVLFAPVSTDVRDNFEKWTRSRTEVAEDIIATYGTPTSSPDFWDSVSPYNYLDNITEPIMLHHRR